jgi:hypothetical protein
MWLLARWSQHRSDDQPCLRSNVAGFVCNSFICDSAPVRMKQHLCTNMWLTWLLTP